jgi:hypothetical protein
MSVVWQLCQLSAETAHHHRLAIGGRSRLRGIGFMISVMHA